MFNPKLIEVARNLIRAECNRHRGTLHADVQKIKSSMPPGHLPFQVKKKIAERYAQELEAWGYIVWQTFSKVFSEGKVAPFPDLASNMKRWVENEIKVHVNEMRGRAEREGIKNAEVINGAGARALARAYAEIDRFVITLPSAPSNSHEPNSRAYSNINISGITGSIVNLGDGATMNIGAITLEDVLRGLAAEIENQVEAPEERTSLLIRLNDFIKHPVVNTAAQVGLPEFLRRLPDLIAWLPK